MAKRDAGSEQPPPHPPRGRRGWRIFKWAVRAGVVLLILGYLTLVGLDGCFYYPDNRIYLRAEELRLPYEDVRFQTGDGLTLAGWYFPAAAEPLRGTIVHFHGNAANITNHLPLVSWLPYEGFNLLMFDYRGYGQSQGRVTRAGTISDGHAALDYALSRPEVRGGPVFVYGHSLGGAVAVTVAVERPEVTAVIAESTFGSYRGIAARHARGLVFVPVLADALAALTISRGHDPIDVVARLAPRPLLVIVAENDRTCFPELGRELYEAAAQPKEFWRAPRADHLDILEHHPSELPRRIIGFCERAGRAWPYSGR